MAVSLRSRRRVVAIVVSIIAIAATSMVQSLPPDSPVVTTVGLAPPPDAFDSVGTWCADGLDAGGLDEFFECGFDGSLSADYQRAHRLADGRILWTFQDAFVRFGNHRVMRHNLGVIQSGRCFTMLTGPAGTEWILGGLTIPRERWYWPMGGEMGADGHVHLFVAEMREQGASYLKHTVPRRMLKVVIRLSDLQPISWAEARDPSTALYGWSVTSDDSWTYLYSHCHRQFGFGGVPWISFGHDAACAADVKVARVPRGHLDQIPQYWTAVGWSDRGDLAIPVIPHSFGTQRRGVNPTQVMYLGGQFVAVTKDADWWGQRIYLDRADRAEGPFTTYHWFVPPTRTPECNTYFASFVPWRNLDGSLIVGLSNNRWDGQRDTTYLPSFFSVPTPPMTIEPAPVGPVSPAVPAMFVPVEPCRVLDTRQDPGTPMAPLSPTTVQVGDRCGVPNGATAAALTVTVTAPSSNGYAAVVPADSPIPYVSNVNFRAYQTRANGALVPLSPTGAVAIVVSSATHVVVDVTGAFVPSGATTSGRFVGIEPTRALDTRTHARPAPGRTIRVRTPPSVPLDATGLAVTVTVVDSGSAGYVTVYPAGSPRPLASVVNADASGQTRASGIIVARSESGLDVFTSAASHVLIDVTGYFTGPSAEESTTGRFVADTPTRLIDTRRHVPSLAAGTVRRLAVGVDANAVVVNLTMVDSWSRGFVVVHPTPGPRPGTSNVNASRSAETNAALAVTAIGEDGNVSVYSSGGADVVVDRAGWFSP